MHIVMHADITLIHTHTLIKLHTEVVHIYILMKRETPHTCDKFIKTTNTVFNVVCVCFFSSSCVVTYETFFSVLLFTCLKFNLDFTWQRASVFVFFSSSSSSSFWFSLSCCMVVCVCFFASVISIPNEYWFSVAVCVQA